MKRTLQEREGHCISGKCEQCSQSTGLHDHWNAAATRRLVARQSTHEVDVLCDESRIKKELERQCAMRVCLKAWEASGAGMEHRLATGQRFNHVGLHSDRHAHT